MTSLLVDCRHLLARGASFERVLSFSRQRGLSKVESISTLATAAALPLGETKAIVHTSKTWGDARAAGEDLHDAIESASKEDQRD